MVSCIRSIFCAVVTCAAFLSMGLGQADAGSLLAADGANGVTGNLWSIDTSTAVATKLGLLKDAQGNDYAIAGMVYSNGVLYASTHRSSPTAPSSLVILDPTLAKVVVSVVGSNNLASNNFLADLTTLNVNGPMYGSVESTLDSLATVNTGTGAATVVGNYGLSFNTVGAGLDGTTGTMYLTPDNTNVAGGLYSVNTTTGAASLIANYSGGANGRVGALQWYQGALYGLEIIGSPTAVTRINLITINTTTAAITTIGVIKDAATGRNVTGLDSLAAVPEPTSVAMVGLGLLGVVGLAARKRVVRTS